MDEAKIANAFVFSMAVAYNYWQWHKWKIDSNSTFVSFICISIPSIIRNWMVLHITLIYKKSQMRKGHVISQPFNQTKLKRNVHVKHVTNDWFGKLKLRTILRYQDFIRILVPWTAVKFITRNNELTCKNE